MQNPNSFQKEEDFESFQELFYLYAGHFRILSDFAQFQKSQVLFPNGNMEGDKIVREEFCELLKKHDFIFVRSERLRRRYTEYVRAWD